MIDEIAQTDIRQVPLRDLLKQQSYVGDFFESRALPVPTEAHLGAKTVLEYFLSLDPVFLEERGLSSEMLPADFALFMSVMAQRFSGDTIALESLTIIGGRDKSGRNEDIEITLHPADVLSIVGPTGSGKSRLLADIEWLAQGDTPTQRRILINGEVPPASWRFSLDRKLVAQLSQNMNFIMDVSVAEFIRMHAASRMIQGTEEKVESILAEANRLAGEPLTADTPVTSLSGGQSRALMIADTAFLSTSPIVLIDEIENAGIDRRTAVDLLIQSEKIVLIATHDPGLALRADRRVVIGNGGIIKIQETTDAEREKLIEIEAIDRELMGYRELLRMGETIA